MSGGVPAHVRTPVDSGALIRVGLITKARGLRGELAVIPLTGDPGRFRKLSAAYAELAGAEPRLIRPVAIEGVRFHREQVFVKLAGCDDADAARLFRGAYISITADLLAPLAKGSYYIFELIGCLVYNERGEELGELTDVLETGGNDVYVVKPNRAAKGGADILVPAIKSVVLEVDVARRRIVIIEPVYSE